jgi:hypothetical protein
MWLLTAAVLTGPFFTASAIEERAPKPTLITLSISMKIIVPPNLSFNPQLVRLGNNHI